MNDLILNEILRAPRITEKGTMSLEKANQVIFRVDKEANKHQIKEAVEKLFNVKVMDVNTLHVSGKVKRFRRLIGRRADWKKAIVRLEEGQTIDFYGTK